MSLFRRSDDAMLRSFNGRGAGEGALSIIGPGMQITGEVSTEGVVRVEGQMQGTIRAGKVVLGKEGEVLGDIITQEAIIAGRITGTVMAGERLELQSSGVVEGDIHTRAQHLKLEEGARFNGHIHMIEETEAMRVLPPASGASPEES